MYTYRYTNKPSPMSDLGHAMFADNEYASDHFGKDNAIRYVVDCSRLRDIADFSDEIARLLSEQYDACTLPISIEQMIDCGATPERISAGFNPAAIVTSAEAWDDADLVQWFYDNIAEPHEVYGYKTADGAIVFDPDMIECEQNPGQYI